MWSLPAADSSSSDDDGIDQRLRALGQLPAVERTLAKERLLGQDALTDDEARQVARSVSDLMRTPASAAKQSSPSTAAPSTALAVADAAAATPSVDAPAVNLSAKQLRWHECSGEGNHCFYLALSAALGWTPAEVAAAIHHRMAMRSPSAARVFFERPESKRLEWGDTDELVELARFFNGRVAFHLLAVWADMRSLQHEVFVPAGDADPELHICLISCCASGSAAIKNHWCLLQYDLGDGLRSYLSASEWPMAMLGSQDPHAAQAAAASDPVLNTMLRFVDQHVDTVRRALSFSSVDWRPRCPPSFPNCAPVDQAGYTETRPLPGFVRDIYNNIKPSFRGSAALLADGSSLDQWVFSEMHPPNVVLRRNKYIDRCVAFDADSCSRSILWVDPSGAIESDTVRVGPEHGDVFTLIKQNSTAFEQSLSWVTTDDDGFFYLSEEQLHLLFMILQWRKELSLDTSFAPASVFTVVITTLRCVACGLLSLSSPHVDRAMLDKQWDDNFYDIDPMQLCFDGIGGKQVAVQIVCRRKVDDMCGLQQFDIPLPRVMFLRAATDIMPCLVRMNEILVKEEGIEDYRLTWPVSVLMDVLHSVLETHSMRLYPPYSWSVSLACDEHVRSTFSSVMPCGKFYPVPNYAHCAEDARPIWEDHIKHDADCGVAWKVEHERGQRRLLVEELISHLWYQRSLLMERDPSPRSFRVVGDEGCRVTYFVEEDALREDLFSIVERLVWKHGQVMVGLFEVEPSSSIRHQAWAQRRDGSWSCHISLCKQDVNDNKHEQLVKDTVNNQIIGKHPGFFESLAQMGVVFVPMHLSVVGDKCSLLQLGTPADSAQTQVTDHDLLGNLALHMAKDAIRFRHPRYGQQSSHAH